MWDKVCADKPNGLKLQVQALSAVYSTVGVVCKDAGVAHCGAGVLLLCLKCESLLQSNSFLRNLSIYHESNLTCAKCLA
jgi:hypothetical protein